MKTKGYLALFLLISLFINVGLGWYVLDLSNQISQQKADYDVLNTSNQLMKHYLFLLLKDDILRGSSVLLNQSAYYLNSSDSADSTNNIENVSSAIYNIDQVLASFRYFTFSAQSLGSLYTNMTYYVHTPEQSMLSNLIEVRNSTFYGNYTQNDIDYLQRVANSLNTVADNLIETGVGQFAINDMDAIVVAFYEIESMSPSGEGVTPTP